MSKSNRSKNQPPVLSKSNQPQKKSAVIGGFYKGPVPPPEILEKMNTILPDAAERIFVMAEKEQNSVIEDRRQIQDRQNKIVENKHVENMTALFMAFCVCILFCLTGTWLILKGFEKSGISLLGTTLIGVVSSFLYNVKKKELK